MVNIYESKHSKPLHIVSYGDPAICRLTLPHSFWTHCQSLEIPLFLEFYVCMRATCTYTDYVAYLSITFH